MTELVRVRLADLDPSPFFNIKRFPVPERRRAAMMRSIADVGVLENQIIARRKGNRFQIAIGYACHQAALALGLEEAWIIVRDLSDEQMLTIRGQVRQEAFNYDFLDLYGAYEAAYDYFARERKNVQQIDIARAMGWMGTDGKPNATARACDAAMRLIKADHMQLSDLEGLSVSSAQQVVERVLSRIEMLEKLGKLGGRPADEIATDKKIVADAGRSVASDYREGNVARKDITQEIDFRAVKKATADDRPSPLFAHFARKVADQLHKVLVDDQAAAKLAEMEKALPLVTMEEDQLALKRIDFALGSLEETANKWRRRLNEPQGKKVVPFKLLSKQGEPK